MDSEGPTAEPSRPGLGTIATWRDGGKMVRPRSMHTATLLPHFGLVFLIGGAAAGEVSAETEMADPSGPWVITAPLAEARYGHTATLLPDRTVLVAGGFSTKDETTPTASAEVYDPARGSWAAVGDMAHARAGHTATLLPDGTVLVTGGASHNGGNGSPLASAEVYDPAGRTWTAVGDMTDARAGHTATLLPDGTVLVVGGVGTDTQEVSPANTALASAELYDPDRKSWTTTGALHEGRAGHTATLLDDGSVLVTRPGRLGSAELFDPGLGSWMTTGNMAHARFAYTATLLTDGTVLVAGGYGDDPLASAERYDPGSGTWVPTADMSHARTNHTATLLSDGTVLVIGGSAATGAAVAEAEIYDPGIAP